MTTTAGQDRRRVARVELSASGLRGALQEEVAMKLHANAQTCPHCRSLIVSRVLSGLPAASVARDFQVSPKTVLKWTARFRAQGRAGLADRSSKPHRIARRHLQPGSELNDAVFALLHTP